MKQFITILALVLVVLAIFITLWDISSERTMHIQGIVPPTTYPITQVTNVVDGDTFDCIIKLPLGISYTCRVRCKGYDAFERNEPKGKAAKEYLNTLTKVSKLYIAIDNDYFDSFGRVLGNVTYVDSNGNLIQLSNDMRLKGFVNETSIWSKHSD